MIVVSIVAREMACTAQTYNAPSNRQRGLVPLDVPQERGTVPASECLSEATSTKRTYKT